MASREALRRQLADTSRPARRWLRRAAKSAPATRDVQAFGGVTGPLVETRYAGRMRPARVLSDARLELLSRSNLDLAVEAATTAGVEYFLLPDREPGQHAIAILDTDAAAFSRALRVRCAGRPVYAHRGRGTVWVGGPAAAPTGPGDAGGVFGGARVTRLAELHTSGSHGLAFGADRAVHVELWHRDPDGTLSGPRTNTIGDRLDTTLQVEVTRTLPFSTGVTTEARAYRTYEPFTRRRITDVDFDIDVVYTWVDGDDPAWIARKNKRGEEFGLEALNPSAINTSRFANRDELRYSLRSIEMFAPWVRTIFLVTDGQRPSWLVDEHPRLEVVDHRDIFPADALPTFNSHAIESRLHHIDGLAEHYLYFNDDVLFGKPVDPLKFFHASGIWKYFVSSAQVELGSADLESKPITSAAKNNRAIIEELFGRTLTFKMRHTPHAARRSVLAEMEERLPEWFDATAHHPFRHPGDISVATSLVHYYAYCTGRAIPSLVKYSYADIADSTVMDLLPAWERKRDLDVFCVNDTETVDPATMEARAPFVARFFESYFPVRSSFER